MEPEVHGPDKAWLYGVTGVLAVVAVGLGIAAVAQQVPWLWLGAAVVAAGVLLFCVYIVRGVPRLVFSADGLAHDSGAHHREWPWAEVGPFALAVARGRGWRQTYVMCALTDARHDLLVKHGEPADATIGNADIVVPLSLLAANRGDAAAQACVDSANTWRQLYGAPAIEAPDDPAAAKKLRRRLRRGQWRRAASVVVIAVALAVAVGAVRWWRPEWFAG